MATGSSPGVKPVASAAMTRPNRNATGGTTSGRYNSRMAHTPAGRPVLSSCSSAAKAMVKDTSVESAPMVSVAQSGPEIAGRAWVQLARVKVSGQSAGNRQLMASDQVARQTKPSIADSATRPMPNPPRPANHRSCVWRVPDSIQTLASRATSRSAPSHSASASTVTVSCNSAPAEAMNRADKSGSLCQRSTATLSGGGLVGPRITATSTTDEE